ncbi:type I polyketide synthase [Nocardia alni]|uniref:type I polyketide synthase n=1 Tax=Nocardia alni TaxID=2815723 RepID=UPI001C23A82E|nr:type I polyketide synthase [Nocardia alni]
MAISADDYLIDAAVGGERQQYRTLGDIFTTTADARGDSSAVLVTGADSAVDVTSLTWSRWQAESRSLAVGLRQMGIGRGDVVAVQLANCWEYLLAHVAIADLGAVLLPLHSGYRGADLRALLDRAGARLVIGPVDSADGLPPRLAVGDPGAAVSAGARSFATLLREYEGAVPDSAGVDPDQPFVLMPSSGTVSGVPKLCLHSHGALLANAERVVEAGVPPADDVVLSASPFSHLFGLLSIHTAMLTGGRQAILPRWDAAACHHLAVRSGVTRLFAVPAQLRDLAHRLDAQSDRLPLREVRTGGAAVPGSLVERIRELTGATIILQWGMSELGAGTVTDPGDPPDTAVRTIGRPLPGSAARVVDDSGLICPDGVTGEFQYRGPHLFRGYLGEPELTRAALTADGWLRTGDRASRNTDGTFTFQGRDAEVLNIGGVKFSASEIEGLLSDLPQVAAAAIGPRPDERLGQYPCLVAALRPGATLDLPTVRAHLLAKGVSEFKLPLELLLVDEVPVTPTGKIARTPLTALLRREAESQPAIGPWLTRMTGLSEDERISAAMDVIAERLAELLPDAAGSADLAFREAGIDSLGAVRLALALSEATGLDLPTTVLFDHPTPRALAEHLVELAGGRDERERVSAGRAVESMVGGGDPGPPPAGRLVESVVGGGEPERPPAGRVVESVVGGDVPERPLAGRPVGLAGGRDEPGRAFGTSGAGSLDDPIVIVGMGCRFPGGIDSPDRFWQLLADGHDTRGPFPGDRGWDLRRLRHPDPAHAGRSATHYGHFLTGAAEFDAEFFGIAPREAMSMDPQQRLLLETTWAAVENAGIDPASLHGSATGVFVGQMASDYAPRVDRAPGYFDGLVLTGSASSVSAGRISYALGLTATALTVDTACSSGLVAVHLAAHALRRGECALALAAGATVMTSPASFVEYSRQGALATDGRCKPFAVGADGTAWGEGVGVLVLERLSRARRHGHPILAVIDGSALNQDGASNGLTAPNGLAQQRVLRAALDAAGLTADRVDAVEAHGTGTPLGDRIELGALNAVFGPGRDPRRPLLLGSVKSNIGHTQAAAGIAGIIKTVLAFRHESLPRTLHAAGEGPVLPLHEHTPWPRSDRVRRAGVSAFGVSGTNAHVILSEPPVRAALTHDIATGAPESIHAPVVPWVLSARSAAALRARAAQLVALAATGEPVAIGHALASTRSTSFDHRAVVLAGQPGATASALRAIADGEPSPDAVYGRGRADRRVVFVFPGQGGQWEGMAAELLAESEVFARAMAECDRALAPHIDWSVTAVLRGEAGQPALERVEVAQTALFAVMVALAELWSSLGVRPHAVIGHSQGEIAAAHVAGALSLADASRVVARRASVIAELPAGAMAAVALPRSELAARLAAYDGRLSVAVDNGPRATVISGEAEALADLTAELGAREVRTTLLPVGYASHSDRVEAVRDRVLSELTGLTPGQAGIPFFSTVTPGRFDTTGLDARYWYRNLRQPVEFRSAVEAALDAGYTDFIEISSNPALVQPILEITEARGNAATCVGSLHRGEGNLRRFLLSAARAYVSGIPVDWRKTFTGNDLPRVELPTYPFQRRRHWWPDSISANGSDLIVADGPDRVSANGSDLIVADGPDRVAALGPDPVVADGSGAVDDPAAPFAATGSVAAEQLPDIEAMLDLVREHAAIVLGHRDGAEIDPDDILAARGAGSMVLVELRARLATALDRSLPVAAVFDNLTPRTLAEYLWRTRGVPAAAGNQARERLPDSFEALYQQACRTGQGRIARDLLIAGAGLRARFTVAQAPGNAPEPRWLVSPGEDTGPVLVLFPSLLPMSGPHEYAALAPVLGEHRPVLALPQPGFDSGRPLPADLDALAAAHTVALDRSLGTRPVLLGGHSSGGLVAHAVAARLESLRRPATGLVLIDSYWPDPEFMDTVLPDVLVRAAGGSAPNPPMGVDRLTAVGGYLSVFSGSRPEPLATPTLLVRAAQTSAEFGAAAGWPHPHTAVSVPGTHFTLPSECARTTAEAVIRWCTTTTGQHSRSEDIQP